MDDWMDGGEIAGEMNGCKDEMILKGGWMEVVGWKDD